MKSTERQLLYEIKERVIRIEDKFQNHENLIIEKQEHEEKQDTRIGTLEVKIGRYDNYFKLRNEIKNAAIAVLLAICSALLAWRFNPFS